MKRMYTANKNVKGFTLVELMIVVAIVAIIAAVALPSYQNHMLKTRRSEGQAKLLEVMNQQERYYTLQNTYTTDLTQIDGYTTDPIETDNAFYDISAGACDSGAAVTACVKLTATAKNGQVPDGNLELDSIGHKTPKDKW